MHSQLLATALLFGLTACSLGRKSSFDLGPAPAAVTPADWTQKGDELQLFIYRNTLPWRVKLAATASGQVKSGLTTAALGVLGVTLTGAISNDKAAKWVGVGMSTATTALGAVTAYKAIGDKVPACIGALDQATTAWDMADRSTEASARAAYTALRTAFGDQAQKCPELGDQFRSKLSGRGF